MPTLHSAPPSFVGPHKLFAMDSPCSTAPSSVCSWELLEECEPQYQLPSLAELCAAASEFKGGSRELRRVQGNATLPLCRSPPPYLRPLLFPIVLADRANAQVEELPSHGANAMRLVR